MSKSFNSVNEAAERWIQEGKLYKEQMNDWLDMYLIDRIRPTISLAEQTRTDMADYVLQQVINYNREGNYEQLRQLFPADTDPLNLKNMAECVSKVVLLPNNTLVVNMGNWQETRRVYLINNNSVVLQENIITFGASWDKKYFAKVYADRIDITAGWDGAVIKTLYKPENYGTGFQEKYPGVKDGLAACALGELGILQVVVFPSGQKIGLASEKGIFVIDETKAVCIPTEKWDTLDVHEHFTFQLETPHLDVSPDERYIVTGSKNSAHLLLQQVDDKWKVVTVVEPDGSNPNFAMFNYECKEEEGAMNDGKQVLLCARGSKEDALGLPLKQVTPGLVLAGSSMFTVVNEVENSRCVLSATVHEWGYQLGCDDGCILLKGIKGRWFGHITIGSAGAIMSMDYDQETKTLVVATAKGQVIVFDGNDRFEGGLLTRDEINKHEKRRDELTLTNTAYKEVKRYLFLKEHEPLVW